MLASVNAHDVASSLPSSLVSLVFSSWGEGLSFLDTVLDCSPSSLVFGPSPFGRFDSGFVHLAILPLALSCSLAAVGLQVFGTSCRTCRKNRSLGQLYVSIQ